MTQARSTSIEHWVPGVRALRTYQRSWLRSDIVSGVVLAAILVPQGMAYAELAGLPPVTGLYTTIACLVGYAVFGPSRVLVLGPDSSLGPLILRRHHPASRRRRRSRDRDRPRRDARALRGPHRNRARPRQARLRRRPAVQGSAGRLHERPRGHHHRGAAAQAVRLLHRRGRLRQRGPRVHRRARPDRHDHARGRARGPRRPPRAAPPHEAGSGGARGRRRSHGPLGRARPGRPRSQDRRFPAPGVPCARLPVDQLQRRRPTAARGGGHHPRVIDRHHRHGHRLRHPEG